MKPRVFRPFGAASFCGAAVLLCSGLPLSAGEPPSPVAPPEPVTEPAGAPFALARRPITNPVLFDSALPQTQIHPVFMHQALPSKVSTTLGDLDVDGDFNLFAVQFEYAFTDRFSLVALKDGYIDFNPDDTLSEEGGWANLAAGLKYAFVYDPESEFVMSGSLVFEAPTGNSDVWQGTGNGVVLPSLSALKLCDRWQFAGSLGAKIPFDTDEESSMMWASGHISYAVTDRIFPLLEVNYFRTLSEGDGGRRFNSHVNGAVPSVIRFEGADLVNFGADHGKDNADVVTLGLGMRFRATEDIDLGASYEIPLTEEKENLMDYRITVDLVWRF